MEKFVIAGKAKTVFQIIELMAKGEECYKKQEVTVNQLGFFKYDSGQLRLALN